MSPRALLLSLIPIAYVLGSIPFGLLVGRAKGVDVRQSGSGNIGATNVARVLGGKRWFFLVFFLDLSKSFLPMIVASVIVHRFMPVEQRDRQVYFLWLLIGCAAILGHMFSMFLSFKGGKGVATSAGVILGLVPYFTWPGFLAIGVFIVVFMVTRIVSLGSMIAIGLFPIFYYLIGRWRGWPVLEEQLPLLIFSTLIALLIIFRHRANIARLLGGTENRFVKKT